MTFGKNHCAAVVLAACAALTALAGCGGDAGRNGKEQPTAMVYIEQPKIDTHAHIFPIDWNDERTGALIDFLRAHDMKWLDICTGGLEWELLQTKVGIAADFHGRFPDRIAWAVSFNIENWGSPDWEEETVSFIERGFENGAVAVKVWKDVGMVLKDPDGSFVMIDDPRFDPVLDSIERAGKTLVCHIGEPRNCWLPLEEMTVNGDRNYFESHPEYHAYQHPEIPGYWEQIRARDAMLSKHPNLRVVGCHLGSLEYDTDELAKRLDAYPNFAVDTAARIIHFKVQDREKVRNFCIAYQDRILYATDLAVGRNEDVEGFIARAAQVYVNDFRYFSTDDLFVIAEREQPVQGLALPPEVVKKIFYGNAKSWYPGI